MKLDLVQISDFRNLTSVKIEPSPKLNIIVGQNGSGKSSLLEALHYLGYGRSFRTSKHKHVIARDALSFNVFCSGKSNGQQHKVGISRDRSDSTRISIDGCQMHQVSALVKHLPIQIFTPQSSEAILGSPSARRRFLDWGLFHVEQSFAAHSSHYRNALKQKNALLRVASPQDIGATNFQTQTAYWDEMLVRYGSILTEARKSHVERIKGYLDANTTQFLPEFSFKISYHSGWEKGAEFKTVLQDRLARDLEKGFLSVGPHKADLKITIEGADAVEVLSRGQLRMLVAALQLAQIQCLAEMRDKSSIFLLDDIGAELDADKREKFVDALIAYDAQLFITAIEEEQLSFTTKYSELKMFHVEHGQVREEH